MERVMQMLAEFLELAALARKQGDSRMAKFYLRKATALMN